jgi:hypothetical protein
MPTKNIREFSLKVLTDNRVMSKLFVTAKVLNPFDGQKTFIFEKIEIISSRNPPKKFLRL